MDDFELYDDLEEDGPSDPISFFAEEIDFEPTNPITTQAMRGGGNGRRRCCARPDSAARMVITPT